MLPILLALLPKVGPAVAALPEFLALINQVKTTLSSNDQATLQMAYELAKTKSDDAHRELQELVAQHTGG